MYGDVQREGGTYGHGEEAFIDLNDPDLKILEESGKIVFDGSEESTSGDAGDHESDSQRSDEEDCEFGAASRDGVDAEDLNTVPDRTPEYDDAIATFTCAGSKPVHAVAVHPTESQLFAASGESEEVHILCLNNEHGEAGCLHTLRGHFDTVSLLSFSPNGKWLASGSLDSSVRLWSTETWEQIYTLNDLYGEIMACLWHPTSLLFIAGADDAQAAMWNVTKGTLSTYFVGHGGAVTTMVWSPDVKKLITGCGNGSISVFNPKTGVQELSLSSDLSPDSAGITALCFVNDDQCVVGCEDGTLHVFSFRGGKIVTHMEDLHDQAIESMDINADLNLLLTSSCDCKVIVWDASSFALRTVHQITESVVPALWAKQLLLAGCSDGSIRVWDGRSHVSKPLCTFNGHRRMVLGMAVSGNTIITGSDDGSVKFFSLTDDLFEEA